MKEAINEAMNEMPDEGNTKLYKSLALFGSTLIFIYFFVILPDSYVSQEVLNEYHWLNQGLIDIKVKIFALINSINKPGNPGNTGGASATGLIDRVSSNGSDSTVTPQYFNSTKVNPAIIKYH